MQIGLVEQEWLDTLSSINTDEVTFIDFIEAGNKLSQQLKEEVNELNANMIHTKGFSNCIL